MITPRNIGNSIAQMIATVIGFVIDVGIRGGLLLMYVGIPLVFLYGLVRFVKWEWAD